MLCIVAYIGFYPANEVFGDGNYLTYPFQIDCTGSENSLEDCQRHVSQYCPGTREFDKIPPGLRCTPTDLDAGNFLYRVQKASVCVHFIFVASFVPHCNNGELRLVGGQSANEGRLEYCFEGLWSPSCTVEPATAAAACKQLGYGYPCQ